MASDVKDGRSMDGLHIRPLNIEKGSDRFSYGSDDNFPPQTASWRNNLIALSQRRNLLFAACNHQVYVWAPTGSSQTLGKKPEMIITPIMKSPDSVGYIAPHFPHAINNMVLGDLGLEEVLLLATDSGNVCGYRVEAVYSALERAAQEDNHRPLNGSQVYPFFMEYVESSAWGLAIHKYSRQIAVSANTGLITVFAFALVDPGTESDLDPDHPMGVNSITDNDQSWYNADSSAKFLRLRNQMPNNYRMRNVRMTYTGHFTNIPSVTFLNCDLDPNGTWMLSTDIDNRVIVWKVWESLSPFNVFHFNDTPWHFMPGMLGNEDRGWSVLALDPRTFRQAKTLEEACGCDPKPRVQDSRLFYDVSEQVTRIPDTSRLYNYFPPAVKTEQEEPTLPDIFSSDCRISSPSNWKSLSTDSPHFQHHDMDKAAYNASLDTAGSFTEGLHPSDSTDAFSHSAAVGSAQGGDASQGISPDADPGTEAHQPPNQGAGDNWNGGGAPLEDLIMQIADTPNPPTHGPLTTAEFLHLALAEGLGGGEYLEGDGEELDDDTESDENDHEMDHADEEEPEEDGQETQDEGSDHSVGSQMDRPPCNLLRCMFRRAFREDHEILKTLIAKQHYSASADPVFPILHFSQTDIRLINSPFANHHTVVCYSPLLQPFTHPIPSVRACDRFNMVQQIPEHGIVVAVSQKGRAAIISLTESDVGFSFRVDWIVPFESQEKYGERPLVPLLGMSVSPIQGFELPPDIPYIPHGEDGFGDLAFRYRVLNHPDYDSPSDHTQESNISSETHLTKDSDQSDQPADTDPDQEQGKKTSPTNAERHAWASRIYRPDEPWRGWNQSRHYRLLLMYADHTVMSYEFWYGSKVAENSGGDSGCEDPYLMI